MEFSDLVLPEGNQFVYRMWDKDGNCLYVGQHAGLHPAARLAQHARDKFWWGEVCRIDYALVSGDLDEAELEQIAELTPKYNAVNRGPQGRMRQDKQMRAIRIDNDLWDRLEVRAREKDANGISDRKRKLHAEARKAARELSDKLGLLDWDD